MGSEALVSMSPPEAPSFKTAPSDWQGAPAGGSPFALPGPAVTLALIGGHRLLRDATASLLSAQDGLHVLGTFESAAHFLAVGVENPPAVLLLDCDRGGSGASREAVAALSSPYVESRLVMLCREISEELIRCAIEHGVSGVILKNYSTAEVSSAIAYVATGRTVMPAGWQRVLARSTSRQLGLSPRHRQILALIAEGRCNEEIAEELELSPNTVKFHIRALYSRLEVRNRVEATNEYAQMISDGR